MARPGSSGFRDNFGDVGKALDNLVSMKVLHEHMTGKKGGGKKKDGYCDGVIRAVIGSAVSGIGPDNQPYPPYKDSYNKQIARAGQTGSKRYLRGLENTGAGGGMLARDRFHMEVDGSGDLWLVWESAGGDMDKYWRVHQGPPLGETHPHIKPRPWFHLQTTATANAAVQAYKLGLEDVVAKFNAKGLRT